VSLRPQSAFVLGRCLCLGIVALCLIGGDARAAHPVIATPYFASMRSATTNVRVGPGYGYPIRWIYKRAGLPVEVLQRYDNWRQIRDSHGEGGWVHAAMLSPLRRASVQARRGTNVPLLSVPQDDADNRLAILKPGVIVRLRSCAVNWCFVELRKRLLSGYIVKSRLWGVYYNEIL
jgi:SH3-like domain-containing protein